MATSQMFYSGPAEECAFPSDEKDTYGGISGLSGEKSWKLRPRRKRMNLLAIALSLFVPWILFAVVYAVMSFSWHYKYPGLTHLINVVCALIVMLLGVTAAMAIRRRWHEDPDMDPTWFVFLFVTSVIGYVVANTLGNTNYRNNVQLYYDLQNLNAYVDVDPMAARGAQFMDASQISFVAGTKVDTSKFMSFKNAELYCVAPIVHHDVVQKSHYDFWAIGLNCCGEAARDGEFNCGDVKKHKAKAGLRLMREDQRAFYRLAVQQAEATTGIRAEHPLFFTWTTDPDADTEAFRDDGVKYYIVGFMGFFGFQVLALVCTVVIHSKF